MCFYFLIVMSLQLSKTEFSDMKITWRKVSCAQICMDFSDPCVCAMPWRGAGICPDTTNSLRAAGRAEKLRQMLLQLYGTYLREAKQRTNAFLLECFKVDSCTDSSSAPTGSTAMHWYNCMHHPFLVLSVTVWEHIAQGLASNMTLKRSTALCFHVFVWAVLEFTAQRMCLGLETSLGEKHWNECFLLKKKSSNSPFPPVRNEY